MLTIKEIMVIKKHNCLYLGTGTAVWWVTEPDCFAELFEADVPMALALYGDDTWFMNHSLQ
jgi:hypothetical protein